MTTVYTFDTTHHALWAEQVALELAAGAQVIPAPADADAKCDLALEVLDEDCGRLSQALDANRISYRIYSPVR